MAQIIDPQAIRENLQSCLRGRALTWWGQSAVQSCMASNSRVEHLIAMLLYYFGTDDEYKDWDYCIERARSKLRLQQYRIEKQRKRDNERREHERLERQKRLKEQELERQQYEMEQQRTYEEQELERQKAEQKAKDEAFACRRCPAKFPSNTKLHVHISAHHSKPSKAASAIMVPSPSTPPTPPISTPAIPLSSSPALVISAASNTSLAPATPPASTPAVTPKLSYAAIAGRHALPTPPTTPKTANPTCAKPKPVYMTMEDLFRKFAPNPTRPPYEYTELRSQSSQTPFQSLQTVAPLRLRPQSLQSPGSAGATQKPGKTTRYSSQGRPWEQRGVMPRTRAYQGS